MDAITGRISRLSLFRYSYALWVLSFSIPFLLPSSQIITGTLVNAFLFLAAHRLSTKDIIPVLVLPSLGAVSRGLLFGPQTVFLYYFLPFIWVGNYVLVKIFLNTSAFPYLFRVLISAFLKFLLLQSFAYLYFQIDIVPKMFVSSMGYVQLFTALTGGMLAFGIIKVAGYERSKNTH